MKPRGASFYFQKNFGTDLDTIEEALRLIDELATGKLTDYELVIYDNGEMDVLPIEDVPVARLSLNRRVVYELQKLEKTIHEYGEE